MYYAPIWFSSAVLPSGKLLIEGGECLNGDYKDWVHTNLGALYDPNPVETGGTWTKVDPPLNWATIGDAPSAILPNGKYLQGNCCTTQVATFTEAEGWTNTHDTLAQTNTETGWTLLPNGKVLMVDVENNKNCNSIKSSELYDYTTDTWSCGPQLPIPLYDDWEIGAAVLTYTSPPQVIQFGFNGISMQGAGATAIYDVNANSWSTGPTPPDHLLQGDGPAALEPNGLVLAALSQIESNGPCSLLEYDPTALTLNYTVQPPSCPATVGASLMVLPSGQIMFTNGTHDVELYTPDSKRDVVMGVAPTIFQVNTVLTRGSVNNLLYGSQLNGLTQNNMFGDDYQAATNYPLLQLIDNGGRVYWAKTHDDSNHSIARGSLGYTKFDMPDALRMPAGDYSLVVITNGIQSRTVNVHVN